jgi:hypothetical protein
MFTPSQGQDDFGPAALVINYLFYKNLKVNRMVELKSKDFYDRSGFPVTNTK